MNSFSIREAFSFGWKKVRAHSSLVFQVAITIAALIFFQMLMADLSRLSMAAAFLRFAASIAQYVLTVGLVVIALKLTRDQKASYGDIVPQLSVLLRYLGATILSGLVIAVAVLIPLALAFISVIGLHASAMGIVLGVIFGIATLVLGCYYSLRFFFVRYLAIDGAHSIVSTLKVSAKMTHGIKWRLLLFTLAAIGLNILGFIALGVGLLVSVPVTIVASAHIYTKRLSHAHAEQ